MAEAYVYITLPGATAAVTAGRFERTVERNGVSVGRFVYGRRYRGRPYAVEIDPVELRLGRAAFETVRMNGVFGALRDAGPDYWGRRVIDKHAGGGQQDELGYLLHSPDDRAARRCGLQVAESQIVTSVRVVATAISSKSAKRALKP